MALTKIDDRGLKTPIDLKNNEEIRLGDNNTFTIKRDSSNGLITTSTGQLWLASDDVILSNKDYIVYLHADDDGGLKINHIDDVANSSTIRFQTTDNGVQLRGANNKEHWCEGHYFPWVNSTYDIGGTESGGTVYYWRDGLFSRNLILRGDSGEFRVEAANGVDAFTVDSDNGNTYIGGNLGIGVSPSKKLHVKGTDVALRLESTEATGRIGMEFYDTSAQKGFFGYPSSGNDHMAIQQNEAADLYFYVNGADRLHIKSDGKVGIGTDSPNRVFSVKGNGGQMSIIDDDDSMMQFYVNSGTGSIWATGGSSIAGALDFATTPSGGSTTSRMQISAAGDVTVNTGSIIMANSGEGIQFHPHDEAVSNPGSDSNTLDDYEEGTFTPTVGTNGTDFSTWPGYTVQLGKYTKVGNLVTCNIYLSWNNAGAGGSGTIALKGLPFTISSSDYTGVSFGWQYWNHQGMNQHNYITAYGQAGQAYMLFLYQRTYNGSSGNTDWGTTYSVVDATFAHNEASFSCTISYQV